jgi:tRNA modification GTPase
MAFSTTDTIVAIATPPGRGGIGVVRLSGVAARAIARSLIGHRAELEPRVATLTTIRVPGAAAESAALVDREAIDRAVAIFFPAEHSYTGEDVVELSAHGSPVVLRAIVASAISCGARLAEPGEFTLRAFLNGRMDLMQAEGVADLIDAVTPLQARVAFDQLDGTLTRSIGEIDALLFDLIARLEASVDFPDEGYHFVEPEEIVRALDDLIGRTSRLLADAQRGRLIREGFQVAIVGRPNVGKSSLFNALVGAPRAIVADVPGTTRDLVSEAVDVDGLRVTFVDTAGIRDARDVVEAEGVARSHAARETADVTLLVVDEDDPPAWATDATCVLVQNKSDLGRPTRGVPVSAVTREGMNALKRAIVTALDVDLQRERPAITNVRHAELVSRAHDALLRARAAAAAPDGAMPEEFVLVDLQDARAALEEVTGRRAAGELLEHIFSRFCVGK